MESGQGKDYGEAVPVHATKTCGEWRLAPLVLKLRNRWNELLLSRSSRSTSGERGPVLIAYEVPWTPELVRMSNHEATYVQLVDRRH